MGCPHFPEPLTAVTSPMVHRGLHQVSLLTAPFRAAVGLRSADVAQLVEHLFCKQAVRGSSPLVSSSRSVVRGTSASLEGCPSGQREQAVNLPAHAYVGSNPTPSTCNVGSILRGGVGLHVLRDRAGLRPRTTSDVGVRQVSGASRLGRPDARPRRVRRFVVGAAVARADRDLVFQDSNLDPRAACAARRTVTNRRGTCSAAYLPDLKRLATPGLSDFAGVAQLVERQPSKLNVEGSSPFSRSSNEMGRSDVLDVSRQGVGAGWRLGRNEVTAHLAQLVEHVLGKDEVTSSNLVVGSNERLYGGTGFQNSKGVGK